jgi:CubicO group peptidase (beta-lactamase class C family)
MTETEQKEERMRRPIRPLAAGPALILALVITVLSLGAGRPCGQDGLALKIAGYVKPLDEDGQLSGTLLVARAGAVVFERSFGQANFELGVPNTPLTPFNVASITKPLTVIMAAHFVESGQLPLEATIDRWFPDFPSGQKITVEMILYHRSGIPHRVTTAIEETIPRTAADMVKLAGKAGLLFEPGSRELYSSAGYSVAARILELVGGKPYERLLEEIVLEPAGAAHTAHADSRRLLPGRPDSYFMGPDGFIPAALKDMSFLVGAGSVYSTPRDILAIIRALHAGTYGDLARRQYPADKKLGWNGISNGFRAFADRDPGLDLTVIFAGNLFTGAIDLIRRDVPKIVAGEDVPSPRVPRFEPRQLPVGLQRKYEGAYDLGNAAETLTFSDGGRYARLGDWVLIPVETDVFFSPQDYARVKVVLDGGGVVQALKWGDDGPGPLFKRLPG